MTTSGSVPSDAPPRPKRIVTLALLRKRSEHNEGLVSSLEELALHQEELQSIGPLLGRTCGKTLKILLLQNNVIERMVPSELRLFRSLEYLNLALNNITKIEGLGGMEFLKKLDLTLNFIDADDLEESVDELAKCRSLEELFLLGNPCMGSGEDGGAKGWSRGREYVVARLPGLLRLDGRDVRRSERMAAGRRLSECVSELRAAAGERREERRRDREKGEAVTDDGTTRHEPETRTKMSDEAYDQKKEEERRETERLAPPPKGEKEWEEEHRETVRRVREREERDAAKTRSEGEDSSPESKGEEGIVRSDDGGIKQCNQGKYQFWFEDESDKENGRDGLLIMRVALPKHLSTSLVDVDVHPTYVSVVIKSKVLRVRLPVEVASDRAIARRSAASGRLELLMPKANRGETAIGAGHVRGNETRATKKFEGSKAGKRTSTEEKVGKGRARLGDEVLNEARRIHSLKIVQNQDSYDENSNWNDGRDEDDDEPPPLC